MKKILLVGGSGLVGQHLSKELEDQGYKVAHLGRKKRKNYPYKFYEWSIPQGRIDAEALDWCDVLVYLAGANVGEGRWTKKRKQEILDSRLKGLELLYEKLEELSMNQRPKRLISASAIGYYGDRADEILDESSSLGEGFLAEVCKKWEERAIPFRALGVEVDILRIGVVFTPKGGALKKLLLPYNFNLGPYLGSGKQYLSWIHIMDLSKMFLFLLENESRNMHYNAVANSLSGKALAAAIGKAQEKSVFTFPVPSIFLKIGMGEMASIVLDSQRVISKEIRAQGFEFQYTNIVDALKDLLN